MSMNPFPDIYALVNGDDPPGLVSRLSELISNEGGTMPKPSIIHVEVSVWPLDGGPRVQAQSEAGDLPKYHHGGNENPAGWGVKLIPQLIAVFGDRPNGKVEGRVWLEGKKATTGKKMSGTLGSHGGMTTGSGGVAVPVAMVPLAWHYQEMANERNFWRGMVSQKDGQSLDQQRIIADMGSRALSVGESVPNAVGVAFAAAHQMGGGMWGQVAQGVVGSLLGGGPAPDPIAQNGARRVVYQIKSGEAAQIEQAKKEGKPQQETPTPEWVVQALEQVGVDIAVDAIALWIIAHPGEAMKKIKADRALQQALKLPPLAVAALR